MRKDERRCCGDPTAVSRMGDDELVTGITSYLPDEHGWVDPTTVVRAAANSDAATLVALEART
jgi:hypothetical protein